MLNKSFKLIADGLMEAGISPLLQFTNMQIGTGEKFTAIVLSDRHGHLRYFRIMPDGMVAPIVSINKDLEIANIENAVAVTPELAGDEPGISGYMPGDVKRVCTDCKQVYDGDDTSIRCAICATEADYQQRQGKS